MEKLFSRWRNSARAAQMPGMTTTWACRTCTLVNEWAQNPCEACSRPRPHIAAETTKTTKRRKKAEGSASASSARAPAKKAKLRQARESDGVVALLCYQCRHDKGSTKQSSLSAFFVGAKSSAAPPGIPPNHCSRCLKPLTKASKGSSLGASTGALPHIERLKSYKRLAKDGAVPYELTDNEATALMRQACSMCGTPADQEKGHGITRLRIWPKRLEVRGMQERKTRVGARSEATKTMRVLRLLGSSPYLLVASLLFVANTRRLA